MIRERKRGYCARCRHLQIFEKGEIHHRFHLLLSVLTCGLWLVSWLSLYIGHRFRPWHCVQCGWHKPQFAPSPPDEGSPAAPANSEKTAGGPARSA